MSMVSGKMQVLLQNNSVVRAMFEEGNRLAAIYGRENVYDFSLGNPNVPAPEAVNQAIRDVLREKDSVYVHGYMSNAGYPEVRRAVADSLNQRFGTAYTENNLVMTVGAAYAMNILLKTILNPGDEVIVIAPFFSEYRNYIGNYDGKTVVVKADPETFQPDPEAVGRAVTPRTRALIINTPNNPSGVVYSEETLKELNRVLTQKEKEFGTVILTISDEPYRELAYDGVRVPWIPSLIPHSCVVYSYSKALSLPGERIGWLLVPDTVPEAEDVTAAAVIANRISGAVNAPSLIQLALSRCLGEKCDVEAYDRNRKLLYNGLKDLGFTCVKPQGAFYLFVKAPDGDDAHFFEACKKYNILVVPCTSFAWPGYVRIAYCVSYDMIQRALPFFAKVAEDCGLKKG